MIVGMTVNEILTRLKSLGDDARRAHNTKAGAPDNQFGVKLGDIRVRASAWLSRRSAPRAGTNSYPLGSGASSTTTCSVFSSRLNSIVILSPTRLLRTI
jgi:hypothetical protein